ncbi:MAG: DUF3987 domain-containing protein, partial [Bacteroidales bacterium]|nr:DUF3987 domain-containing protein [Bacteroidales bacterium]
MNKKTFNPSEWLNKADNTPTPQAESKAVTTDIQADIETVTRRIEKAGKDITAGYAPWRDLGFALADALGEDGRSYYHRLSRFNKDYNQAECDKQYTACLNAHGHGITIKTFFQLAKDHGISVSISSISSKSSKPSVPSGAISEGNCRPIPSATPAEGMEGTEETEGPTITDTLPYPLPDFLQKVIARKKSTEDADLLLLGALAVISACLPGISGEYDELIFYPNFFLFVTGNASAGKGRLTLCRALAEPIHEELRQQNEAENAEYEKQLAAYNASKNKQNLDKPKAPPLRILFIPANTSATAFYQTLSENYEKGLMFETEGDTLANTFAADHGHYSEGFRQAFQHEPISYSRRKDREYVNVKRPRLSAVLSGTPRQIQNLITDTENGLFSRFVFYRLPTRVTWHNVFAKSGNGNINEYFAALGAEFFDF